MFSTVASGLVMLAERTRDTWPGHAPFVRLHEVVKDMNEDALRDAMDNYLLPVAAQLQKKNLGYFRQDPTFEALDLSNVDLESQPKALEEIFTVLNHTLLLQSTMSLLPDNLLNVAQTMASQMTSVVKPDGSIDPDAMQSILGEAMQAAGLHRQHIADMDPETAQQKLKEARRNLI